MFNQNRNGILLPQFIAIVIRCSSYAYIFNVWIKIRGTLHVSGDGLRVVDKDTKGLVLDQTIEKVNFCLFFLIENFSRIVL